MRLSFIALAGAALFLSSAPVSAAPLADRPLIVIDHGDQPGPDRPDRPDIDNNEPYDEGIDVDDGPGPEHTPHVQYPMICELDRLVTDGEHVTVWFKNDGDTVIPAGTWIVVTYPDGTKAKYKLPFDLAPHGGWGFWLPDGVWDFKGDFDCNVHVTASP